MAKPTLVIYHHFQPARGRGAAVHTFSASRMQFTAEELASARIVPAPKGVSAGALARRVTSKRLRLRFPFVSLSYGAHPFEPESPEKVLVLGSFYPYPHVTDWHFRPVEHEKLAEGGRGLGTVFGNRVFRYLTGVYPRDTPVALDPEVSPPLLELLNRVALARGGTAALATLGDHADGFAALVESKGKVLNNRSAGSWMYRNWWEM